MFKFTKPNLHDLLTAVILFVSVASGTLATSASLTSATLYAAISAGLGAVVHNYLAPKE